MTGRNIQMTGRLRRGQSKIFWRIVNKRNIFTAHTLGSKLIETGIPVTGGVVMAALESFISEPVRAGSLPIELARVQSPPVRAWVAKIDELGDHFLADRLIRTTGAQIFGGLPTMGKGVRVMQSGLDPIGVDTESVVLDTGLDLSYDTKMSARPII